MIDVLFRSGNKERLLSSVDTMQDVQQVIDLFLAEHNYKCYYTRRWKEPDGRTVIDVGSWSEFFVLKEYDV